MKQLMRNIIQKIRLLTIKDKEPYLRVYEMTGYMPHDIELYTIALRHKSASMRTDGRHRVNNERLEFLGDAVLGAVVAEVLYKRFPDRQEGFLTKLRSRIVCRESLNHLATELGLDRLITYSGIVTRAHNSYIGGNAFEAFVGALYLDHGYEATRHFMEDVIFRRHIDIEKMMKADENYKSMLIEWTQKHGFSVNFEIVSQKILPDRTTPKFVSRVSIEGVYCGSGEGFSKKESHQHAARTAYKKVRSDVNFVNQLFEAKRRDKTT